MENRSLENMIDNIGRSFLRGHPKNSDEGRQELLIELAEAANKARDEGDHRAIDRARQHMHVSILIGALPWQIQQDTKMLIATALGD